MKHLSTALMVFALLLLPLLIWAESTNQTLYSERLYKPDSAYEPDLHVPKQISGTYLPITITSNLHLTPDHNPVIISFPTRVAKDVTLSADPGTNFYFNEFSYLYVEGRLSLIGTPQHPILFTSNETHPLNQTWGGIISAGHSQIIINNTHFENAAVSLSCLDQSHSTISNSSIKSGSVGIYTTTNSCQINGCQITNVNDGVISVNASPLIKNTSITAHRDQIRSITNPTIPPSTFRP